MAYSHRRMRTRSQLRTRPAHDPRQPRPRRRMKRKSNAGQGVFVFDAPEEEICTSVQIADKLAPAVETVRTTTLEASSTRIVATSAQTLLTTRIPSSVLTNTTGSSAPKLDAAGWRWHASLARYSQENAIAMTAKDLANAADWAEVARLNKANATLYEARANMLEPA